MTRMTSAALSLGLVLACGWALGALVGAALTGAIDGPGAGRDVVEHARAPALFWWSVTMHAVIALASGRAASHFFREAIARPSA